MIERKGWIPIKSPTDAFLAVCRVANLITFTCVSTDGIQGLQKGIPVDIKLWGFILGVTLAGTTCSYVATICPEKGRHFLLNSAKIFSRGHSNQLEK